MVLAEQKFDFLHFKSPEFLENVAKFLLRNMDNINQRMLQDGDDVTSCLRLVRCIYNNSVLGVTSAQDFNSTVNQLLLRKCRTVVRERLRSDVADVTAFEIDLIQTLAVSIKAQDEKTFTEQLLELQKSSQTEDIFILLKVVENLLSNLDSKHEHWQKLSQIVAEARNFR